MHPAAPSKQRPAGSPAGGIALMAAIGGALLLASCDDKPKQKTPVSTVINVTLPPPPPPPPLPPPPQVEPPPPEERKMIEAEPVVEDTPPEEAPAPEEPPAELTTNLSGGTGNDFGLKQGSGKGNFGAGGNRMIGGQGSKWGTYNAGLSRTIEQAIERHPVTRAAKFPATRAVITLDATGRIERARILGSTGSSAVDTALAAEILPGVIYRPQPADMPSPIVIRIRGR